LPDWGRSSGICTPYAQESRQGQSKALAVKVVIAALFGLSFGRNFSVSVRFLHPISTKKLVVIVFWRLLEGLNPGHLPASELINLWLPYAFVDM
jgi:hypothetical protein